MSAHHHALVWIDHRVAKVFHFDKSTSEHSIVHSSHPEEHIHHKANSGDSGHAAVDKEFLHRVVQALAQPGAILIAGPGNAKTELRAYIQKHDAKVAGRISAVEALDHPTDPQLLAYGRNFYKAELHMDAVG
jgi:stalled ribosome rescue protein Dom34